MINSQQQQYVLRCINKDISQQEKAIENAEYDSVKQIRSAIKNLDDSIDARKAFEITGY